MLGRATVLLFVTTFDPASQVVAEHVDSLLRSHRPRANGLVVVLEAAKYATLAEVYGQSLDLTMPVVLAGEDSLGGEGPFGKIGRVPTTFILDAKGRVIWTQEGLVTPRQVAHALELAERGE